MSKRKSIFGGGYSQKDAKRDTRTSTRKTRSAWHQARDDAARSGEHGVPKNRHRRKK